LTSKLFQFLTSAGVVSRHVGSELLYFLIGAAFRRQPTELDFGGAVCGHAHHKRADLRVGVLGVSAAARRRLTVARLLYRGPRWLIRRSTTCRIGTATGDSQANGAGQT